MMMNLFYNSEVLFVEYLDILKAPQYYLLDIISNSDKLSDILDVSQIQGLKDIGKVEWYLNRKHFNIFEELQREEIPKDVLDKMLYTYLSFDNRLIQYANKLKFFNAIDAVIKQKLVKKIVIYLPYEDKSIEKDFEEFKFNFTFMYGDFKECVKELNSDATYVISDIDKVNQLNEIGKLQLSSVMIPREYRYNKINMKDFKIDFTELNKEVIFKYAIFNAFI